MFKQRPFLVEILTAIGLIAAPLILPHLGFSPGTINRILVWGLFGIGFDILFGYTALRGRSGAVRLASLAGAMLSFGFIYSVARAHHPLGV